MAHKQRTPGFSFVIRARNEASRLFDNLWSLRTLTVPHEIIVVLHRCRDESRKVTEELRKQGLPIRVFEDQTPVSRAGYETIITPVHHPNSFPAFCARCFSHAQYNWLLRWDADFKATEFFLDMLQHKIDPAEARPMSYQLRCMLGDDVMCREEYMFNTYLGFGKYYCWEHCLQVEPRESIIVDTDCIQSIPPTEVKPYWVDAPWFTNPDTYDEFLAKKYEKIIDILGPEPLGFARSNNPEFFPHWHKLLEAMPTLAQFGIYPDK